MCAHAGNELWVAEFQHLLLLYWVQCTQHQLRAVLSDKLWLWYKSCKSLFDLLKLSVGSAEYAINKYFTLMLSKSWPGSPHSRGSFAHTSTTLWTANLNMKCISWKWVHASHRWKGLHKFLGVFRLDNINLAATISWSDVHTHKGSSLQRGPL